MAPRWPRCRPGPPGSCTGRPGTWRAGRRRARRWGTRWWAWRRDQHVDPLERGLEVPDDQGAHLLGLAVVGVVVAARQGVGAEHDPALDLSAEPLRTGERHDLLGAAGAVVADPQAVPHAIEPGQVGRGFAGRDQVVSGKRVAEVRAGHFDDLRAERLQQLDHLTEPGHDPGLVSL